MDITFSTEKAVPWQRKIVLSSNCIYGVNALSGKKFRIWAVLITNFKHFFYACKHIVALHTTIAKTDRNLLFIALNRIHGLDLFFNFCIPDPLTPARSS
jgi:hypothetical protein